LHPRQKQEPDHAALEERGRGSDRAEAESASASRKLALHGPGASAAEIDSHQADRLEEALSQNPSPPPKRTYARHNDPHLFSGSGYD
jgi:hypothetical protein